MPTVVSGKTNAATIMIAERGRHDPRGCEKHQLWVAWRGRTACALMAVNRAANTGVIGDLVGGVHWRRTPNIGREDGGSWTFAAAATSKLLLGTGVCLITEHDPIVAAKSFSSVLGARLRVRGDHDPRPGMQP
jgi:hypothetical protein